MYIDRKLKSSASGGNGYYGLCVIFCHPWHLRSVYNSQKKEEKIKEKVPADYSVFYGVYFSLDNEFAPELLLIKPEY